MHELSLAVSTLELVEAAARREGCGRVRVVRMEIGALSCVDPEALRFAFDSAAGGTRATGARLEIDAIAGQGECPVCGEVAAMAEVHDRCPRCGGHPMRVRRGMEMRLKDIEVEDN